MPRRPEQPDRRDALLEEALGLLARGGLQAVTHRAVERAAGVPHGSVTYHFGTRDDLIAAMIDRLVERCERDVARIAREVTMALAAHAGRLDAGELSRSLVAWMDEGRDDHLARMELELAAARDPGLRERMSGAAFVFWRLCEPLALALGSPDPALDGRAMAAAIDGLLLDRLAHDPRDTGVVESGVRQLLRSWERPDPA